MVSLRSKSFAVFALACSVAATTEAPTCTADGGQECQTLGTHLLQTEIKLSTKEVDEPLPFVAAVQVSSEGSDDYGEAQVWVMGSYNSNSCPEGSTAVTTESSCKHAAVEVGSMYDHPGSWDNSPRGCHIWGTSTFFNSHSTGAAELSSYPICEQANAAEPPEETVDGHSELSNPQWDSQVLSNVDGVVAENMNAMGASALSIAIAKDGKLMLAKGYGSGIDQHSKFRIASVSKPITAVAIFTLVDKNLLKLSDEVFDILSTYRPLLKDWRANRITIKQLLEHRCGGWGGNKGLMWLEKGTSHDSLIKKIVSEKNLDTEPGTKYDYSNFGYSLLGRVIEKLSGKTYEQYVQDAVLQPSGISHGSMAIAFNSLADRQPNEVEYITKIDESPYSLPVRRMDSHGGWIATPIDLVRFALKMDDILSPSSYKTMTAKISEEGYAKGWGANDYGSVWHSGLFAGSSAFLMKHENGFAWAVVANTDSFPHGVRLEKMMWKIHGLVGESWPTNDLYSLEKE